MKKHIAVVLEIVENEPLEPKVFGGPDAHVYALEHFQRICDEQELFESDFDTKSGDSEAGDDCHSVHLWYIS